MNSLNILSSRVSPPPSTAPSRSNSITSLGLAVQPNSNHSHGGHEDNKPSNETEHGSTYAEDKQEYDTGSLAEDKEQHMVSEYSPLLGGPKDLGPRSASWHVIPRRIAVSFINSFRWLLSTLAAPGVYLFACFCNEQGKFSPFHPIRRLYGWCTADSSNPSSSQHSESAIDDHDGPPLGRGGRPRSGTLQRLSMSSGTSESAASESERDSGNAGARRRSRAGSTGHSRSRSMIEPDDLPGGEKRSIRIRLSSDEALRQRRHRKTQSTASRTSKSGHLAPPDISAQLKSPTSPVTTLTKYPKTPAPPRPLIPRRQPSYLNLEPTPFKHQKTLIIDLDETLIHSMSKGGRMSTGHMVEVRLNTTLVGAGGETSIGPLHPILYYVHKRPFCDDFLRRVCKWFNLVIFTASVQEYADPVIDFLEQERKFFSARYYRQHCTYRQGAFIKDLSSVEPDLSKVMILDNSPLSYMFHQDNAIPIQGWINDPTDSDLLHLVPFLEGLHLSGINSKAHFHLSSELGD
ncbi:related to nuclear envelope protein NEM1 [Cephalotrichum gorgonifer]|uniref:Related to nuclear envelope protein NEM1 n=1 Tax=Cephalotrichum gorgonifer TaxID=2041049 RepID=A0AAE8MQB5_9PEZI|nr:related to nuclear envelope protein NEM1 [Cephalotrichum gorgonifer]